MIAHKSRRSLIYGTSPVLYMTMMILAWHYRPKVNQRGIILNQGIAFGLLSHVPSWFLSLGTLGVMVVMAIFLWRWPTVRLSLSWLLAAAAANWTDRILWGGVVDYWQIRPYPFIFNLADVVLRLASVLLVIQAYRHFRSTQTRTQPSMSHRSSKS